MSVILKLASSLGRRDEIPNQQLAQRIAKANDKKSVQELVENLSSMDRNIQSDCIKVLYEIAELKPSLIAGYVMEFVTLLGNKNNRLVWGAMTALNAMTLENPKAMYAALPKIIAVANSGSVITRDHAVGILIKLASIRQYADKAFALLIEQLKKARPTNCRCMQRTHCRSSMTRTRFCSPGLFRPDSVRWRRNRRRRGLKRC